MCIENTKMKKKRPGMAHFLTKEKENEKSSKRKERPIAEHFKRHRKTMTQSHIGHQVFC